MFLAKIIEPLDIFRQFAILLETIYLMLRQHRLIGRLIDKNYWTDNTIINGDNNVWPNCSQQIIAI